METKIARCFAFVGPHLPLDANYAIGNFIRDALRGGPIQVQGDGTPWRSYLYAADLAVWLWTLLFRGPAAEPVNVGSDQAVSIAQLAHRVQTLLAPGAEVIILQEPKADVQATRYVPSIERARALGLETWIDLDEAILRTAAWHRTKVRP